MSTDIAMEALRSPVLAYAGAMAVCCHLFVIGYEEPTLRRRFGSAYLEYRRAVPRWIPRPPRQPVQAATGHTPAAGPDAANGEAGR